MKKRVLSFFVMLAVVLTLLPGTALAASTMSGTCGAEGDNVKWSLSDGVLTFTGSGAMRQFEADKYGEPDEIVPWLDQMYYIQKVVIGDGITTIGNYAFWNFWNLVEISIADSVEYIGCDAFYNCGRLTSIDLPDSLKKIDMAAFASCSGLKRVDIPAGVNEISYDAFRFCGSGMEIHFKGDAPEAVQGADSFGPSFETDAVLCYREGTSGWDDEAYYDAEARTWRGFALRSEPPFYDVAAGAWYADTVTAATKAGIVAGYGDGSFNPDGKLTWAQAVAFAVRTYQLNHGEHVYSVADQGEWDQWFRGYVDYAKSHGIIGSAPENPNAEITRADAAVIFAAAIEEAETVNHVPAGYFTDTPAGAVHDAVYRLAEAGIVNGKTKNADGTMKFGVGDTLRRSEVATIVARMAGLVDPVKIG